jgi:hypothetical protein
VIVVFIEPAKLLRFPGTFQLSFDVAVLPAVVGLEQKIPSSSFIGRCWKRGLLK